MISDSNDHQKASMGGVSQIMRVISLKLSRVETAIPERNKNNTSSHQHTNPETPTMPMPLIDPTMTPWPMSVSRKVFRTLTGEGYSMSGRPDKLGMTSRNPKESESGSIG